MTPGLCAAFYGEDGDSYSIMKGDAKGVVELRPPLAGANPLWCDIDGKRLLVNLDDSAAFLVDLEAGTSERLLDLPKGVTSFNPVGKDVLCAKTGKKLRFFQREPGAGYREAPAFNVGGEFTLEDPFLPNQSVLALHCSNGSLVFLGVRGSDVFLLGATDPQEIDLSDATLETVSVPAGNRRLFVTMDGERLEPHNVARCYEQLVTRGGAAPITRLPKKPWLQRAARRG